MKGVGGVINGVIDTITFSAAVIMFLMFMFKITFENVEEKTMEEIRDCENCIHYKYNSEIKTRMCSRWNCEPETLEEHDKQIVKKAYEWLMNMDIINCDGCNYQSECLNNNENCFDVMAKKFFEEQK